MPMVCQDRLRTKSKKTAFFAQLNWCHLSAGDLLRAERKKEGSPNADLINSYIKEGKIVPVEITVKLLQTAMAESGKKNFLIDGTKRQFLKGRFVI
jgi:adenylate kinase family enzyme